MSNYDSWLIEPYERQQAELEMFHDFCEQHDIEPNNPNAHSMYEDFMEQLAEEEAEAAAERLEWERDQDYDYDYEY